MPTCDPWPSAATHTYHHFTHPTLYNGCDYLSMLGLKLIHVSKRGPRAIRQCQVYAAQWRIVPAQNRLVVVANVWYRSAWCQSVFDGWVMAEWFKTLVATVGGEGCLLDPGVPGSTLASTSWSNSLIIGIYPAASARSRVLIFPSYKIISMLGSRLIHVRKRGPRLLTRDVHPGMSYYEVRK